MARHQEETVLSFLVDYYDPQPQLVRRYELRYFSTQHMVEMRDLKANRMFLRKSPAPPHVSASDLVIGARVVIYGRTLTLVDFANQRTRELLKGDAEKGALAVRADNAEKVARVLAGGEAAGLRLCRVRMVREGPGESTVLAEFVGDGAASKVRDLAAAEGAAAVGAWPASPGESTAGGGDCTLGVILPHVVKDKGAGKVLHAIVRAGFGIGAMGLFALDRSAAERFLEVYQGVRPDYGAAVDELYAGPCLAVQLLSPDAVASFRAACGPFDVAIAKEIRPGTLRAAFGEDDARCAVHCTDLAEDAAREVDFFVAEQWQGGALL